MVNCLSFGRQSSQGHRWLYSGHRDGTITKWDCQSMTSVWTARAYGKCSDGVNTSFSGVTQMIVNSSGTHIFCITKSNLVMSFLGALPAINFNQFCDVLQKQICCLRSPFLSCSFKWSIFNELQGELWRLAAVLR